MILGRLRGDLLNPGFGNQESALLGLGGHDFSGTWHVSAGWGLLETSGVVLGVRWRGGMVDLLPW